jgi:hypothetical protein
LLILIENTTTNTMLAFQRVSRALIRPARFTAARGYRGGSGEQVVREMTEAEKILSAKSADIDSIIRAKHMALPTREGIPADSLKGSGDDLDVRRKRLIYR